MWSIVDTLVASNSAVIICQATGCPNTTWLTIAISLIILGFLYWQHLVRLYALNFLFLYVFKLWKHFRHVHCMWRFSRKLLGMSTSPLLGSAVLGSGLLILFFYMDLLITFAKRILALVFWIVVTEWIQSHAVFYLIESIGGLTPNLISRFKSAYLLLWFLALPMDRSILIHC